MKKDKQQTVDTNYVGRPIQTLSYAEKVANEDAWGKRNVKYLVDGASFDIIHSDSDLGINIKSKKDLFNAYNNIIPSSHFNYATDPYNATDAKFKRFPAQIRPYNILRPNIDLYIGEWEKRPFTYDVINVDGEDAYNSFLAVKESTYKNNLSQRFINTLNQLGEDTGLISEDIPDPKTVITELNLTYKDAKALQGYRALKALEFELELREMWRDLIKDFTIAGDMYTLKLPMDGDIYYTKLSSLNVSCDKGNSKYVEDGEWAVARFAMSVSEIVEFFYNKPGFGDTKEEKKTMIDRLDAEMGINYSNIGLLNKFTHTDNQRNLAGKRNVFFTTWKSKKLVGFLEYPDPLTGEVQYDIVDEDYKPDKDIGEKIDWMYVDETWTGWAIEKGAGDYEYIDIKPLESQRNEMNGFSSCKLPINGKCFSDTESPNVSPLYLGLPYQIMYIIMMYRLELTIARSKGKVVLMDINTIPEDDGEEGFFWYTDTTGFGLIDRSQDDVDRSWNQYMTVDFSLFKDIKQLIDIANFYKQEWDELLGITRQRKGQTTSSDGLGTTEQAIFRSSIVSEIIFAEFESFIEKELQGLLDLTKFSWVDGKKGYYRNSDGRLEMFSIDPDDYVNADLGIFVDNISSKLDKMNLLRQQINAVAQRKDIKVSTIIDLVLSDSITEIKALARKAEAIEADSLRRQAKAEAERTEELEKLKRDYDAYIKMLDTRFMHAQEDRLDNREYIKAELEKIKQDPDGATLLAEVERSAGERLERLHKLSIEQQKVNSDRANEQKWQQIEREKIASAERIAKDNNRTKLKNKVAGEK